MIMRVGGADKIWSYVAGIIKYHVLRDGLRDNAHRRSDDVLLLSKHARYCQLVLYE